jgi:glutaconyl-CoA/methylmalonyl-CoA decarboxylase subunit gamma
MKKYLITVNQNQYEVEVVEVKQQGNSRVAQTLGSAPKIKTPAANSAAPAQGIQGKEIMAPMPGNVLDVMVCKGDVVKKGQKLLVFEAMKMENELTAPADGTVHEIRTAKGSTMAAGDLLMVLA